MKFLEKERKQLEHELETLEREYRSSNLVQREKELNSKLEALSNQISQIEMGIYRALMQIRGYGQRYGSPDRRQYRKF